MSSAESLAVHNYQSLDGPARNRVRLLHEDAVVFPSTALFDKAAVSPLCLSQEVLELAFSVLYDPDETLNFVAPNKYEVSSAGGREA